MARKGEPDEPHRHDFFTVLIITSSKGRHIIDFNEYELDNNQLFFISPGQVHQMVEEELSKGYVLLFSNNFLIQNDIPVSFINDLHLFRDFGESPPLVLNIEEIDIINNYTKDIFNIYHSDLSFKDEAIGALLKLILIRSNNICSLSAEGITSASRDTLLGRFKELVNDSYMTWHSTKDYASALNITPDHLNRIVKSKTGKTTKEHLQNRIILAAKRLLHFTNLTNKEIGFELGFSEPANFSAFFKKCVGESPSQFKKNKNAGLI